MVKEKNRKYVILVGDGMGDYPLDELDGKTPLEAAQTPHMDRLAAQGVLGWVQTVPPACEAGSDIANLSLMGYDPLVYHTGRAPLEAASLGLRLRGDEVAFRCNLVHLERTEPDRFKMGSYSAGHITSEEGRQLVAALNDALQRPGLTFHPGVSYRHLLVWDGGDAMVKTRPPHDLTGQDVTDYLFDRGTLAPLVELMRLSWPILEGHPVNRERLRQGKLPANSIWLWGQGKQPAMPPFLEQYGRRGGIISAVDLLRGIGTLLGWEVLPVPGITGYLDTNYRGKAEKTLEALKDLDLVYVHVEAPDESSHEGSLENKLRAIEDFDRQIVGPVRQGLEAFEDYALMVVTDHFTPLSRMTHTREPVPMVVYRSVDTARKPRNRGFSERTAIEGEVGFPKGDELMAWFLNSGSRTQDPG
jgi:2,3-bisphosphoglycerate-independent phosphoglycerate mutase